MKKGIILSILFAVFGVFVFGQSIDGFEYKIDRRGMVITGYTGGATRVKIPEKINGRPVTAIGYKAFAFDHLESVSIPDSVKYIATGAFYDNQLTSIILPASLVSIGDIAFSYNRISSVIIPDSVVKIGANAFSKNSLTNIRLPENADIQSNSFYVSVFDKYLKSGKHASNFSITIVLSNLYKIAILDASTAEILAYYGDEDKLVLPEKINGIPVVDIGCGVFSNCLLTSVVIPNSVEIIGDDSFPNNKLTHVVIPNSVRFIGNGAFIHNQISDITLPDFLAFIGNAAFTSNNLTEVTLPDSLVSIGFAAFSSNKLSNVTIPDSVKSIGDQAFDPDVKMESRHFSVSMRQSHNSYQYH